MIVGVDGSRQISPQIFPISVFGRFSDSLSALNVHYLREFFV